MSDELAVVGEAPWAERARRLLPPDLPAAISGLFLLANAVVLYLVGVHPLVQLGVVAYALLLALAGACWLHRIRAVFPDWVTFGIASFVLGMFLAYGLCFVLFHRTVCAWLGAETLFIPGMLATAVLAGMALFALPRLRRVPIAAPAPRSAVCFCLGLALLLSTATYYGFHNSANQRHSVTRTLNNKPGALLTSLPAEQPIYLDWGSQWDKPLHLLVIPLTIEKFKLPDIGFGDGEIANVGAAIIALHAGQHVGASVGSEYVKAVKVLAFFLYFSVLYLSYTVATSLFALSPRWGYLCALGAGFFAPANYPLTDVVRSSYLGLLSSSGLFYHNSPQLFMMPSGLLAAYLVASSWERKLPQSFVAGCVFAASSFFFKPSFFSVLAPAICLMTLVLWDRIPFRTLASGVVVLFLPVIFWTLYPLLIQADAYSTDPIVRPFAFHFHFSEWRFPAAITSRPPLFAASITGLSFLFLVPLGVDRMRGLFAATQSKTRERTRPRLDRLSLFYSGMLLLSLGSATLLQEDNDLRWHGNFTMASAAAIVAALPLLFRILERTPAGLLKRISFLFLALHFWAGFLYLVVFVIGDPKVFP